MIVYQDSAWDCPVEALQGFFVGWPHPPSPRRLLEVLQASAFVVLAVETGSGRVVGLITALSDGISCAYIPHLEVLPAYQGQGIGSQLVRRMLEKLEHIYMVDLVCDESLQPFYARLGLQPYTAMIRRNYARQAWD